MFLDMPGSEVRKDLASAAARYTTKMSRAADFVEGHTPRHAKPQGPRHAAKKVVPLKTRQRQKFARKLNDRALRPFGPYGERDPIAPGMTSGFVIKSRTGQAR